MENKKVVSLEITSFTLHILAMAFMLSDHLLLGASANSGPVGEIFVKCNSVLECYRKLC